MSVCTKDNRVGAGVHVFDRLKLHTWRGRVIDVNQN